MTEPSKLTLAELMAAAKEHYEELTPEEKEKLAKEQRESFVRSIAQWPKPKYKWVNGVKVYDSYEDYCND